MLFPLIVFGVAGAIAFIGATYWDLRRISRGANTPEEAEPVDLFGEKYEP